VAAWSISSVGIALGTVLGGLHMDISPDLHGVVVSKLHGQLVQLEQPMFE
jgi:hypothetical protein